MTVVRLALANLAFPASREASVANAIEAIAQAGAARASIICFPEWYLPGYRSATRALPPPDAEWLERAWTRVAVAAGMHRVAVVLGTERPTNGKPMPSALVIDEAGKRLGFQDKVQIDPSEEGTYACGSERRVFTAGGMTFGIAICHEGWRYPETVRAAVRQGAQVVFHPHFHEAERGS